MRRFRVTQWQPPTLDREAHHHALEVIRLRIGEEVVLFDGNGQQAKARLTAVEQRQARFELLEAPEVARPVHSIHLFLAVLKGPAMDDAIRMATEAGMTELHPLLSERTIAKGDRIERWERIAESAAQQCGRGDIPTIHPVTTFSHSLAFEPTIARRIAIPGASGGQSQGAAAVWIGPEGGFSPQEVEHATRAGMEPLNLGRWVFRADTAAAVAVALLAKS